MSIQLLLSYDFPPMGGGIARWMGELAKRYPAGSLVVSTGRGPDTAASDAQFPNWVDRLPIMSERLRTLQGLFLWSRRIARLAGSLEVEFIWCGNIKPATYPARMANTRFGIPYGILVHGGDLLIMQRQIRHSILKRLTARALLGRASAVVANSEWTRDLCRSILHQLEIEAAGDKVHTVPLGADPVLFRPGVDQAEVRSRYGLNGGRWLLSVARLTPHKGIDTGIRVLATLRGQYPELGYAVVGAGDQRDELESLARGLGVSDRVCFLANVPDRHLPALYNTAEIYLGLSRAMPDRIEGFGISLVEAAACAKPVVAGRTGGIADAVREGETGLLVNPDSPGEVCRAVQSLLEDPERAGRMGRAGRRVVETYYNWDRVAADLRRIGHELGTPVNRRSYHHDK
jgi:phosphatidylinositol alpha-1,6-mannosyltransferase